MTRCEERLAISQKSDWYESRLSLRERTFFRGAKDDTQCMNTPHLALTGTTEVEASARAGVRAITGAGACSV